MDITTISIVGVSAVVVVLIIITVLLCCCFNEVETPAPNDVNLAHPSEITPLLSSESPQGISSQSFIDDSARAVISKVDDSRLVVSFEQHPPDTRHKLQKHRAFLRNRIDVDFGLLDMLQGSQVLSYEGLQVIKSKSPFQERNATLIDYIVDHNCYEGLREALKETNQLHIVNYLEANGEYRYSKTFDGVWPLQDRIVRAIDSNRHSLLDLIEPYELVHKLVENGVINNRHREAISARPTTFEKNEALLDIMRRISIKDYCKAMRCFEATKQNHLVQALSEGGTIVRTHAHLQGVEELSQVEKELVDSITYQLRNQTTAYADLILRLVEQRLIGVTIGNSVVCHFHCPRVDDIERLLDKLRSHELEKSLDAVFRQALPKRHIAGVAITSVDNQYADKTVYRDPVFGSLERSISHYRSIPDDIETSDLYSIIMERDFPVNRRAWRSRRSSSLSK